VTRAAHFRVSSLYFLIGMNLVVLVILLVVTGYVASLGNRLDVSRASQREACERGNVLRDSTRLNTVALARMATIIAEQSTNPDIRSEFLLLVPELDRRASIPRIQPQDCLALYPK